MACQILSLYFSPHLKVQAFSLIPGYYSANNQAVKQLAYVEQYWVPNRTVSPGQPISTTIHSMSTILMALGSWSFVRDPICRISYSLWLAKRPLKLFFLPIQHSIEIYITSKIFTYACVYMSFAKRTFCDGQNDGSGWGMWLCGGESRVEHTNTFLYVCLA